jgi:hypothetical protein
MSISELRSRISIVDESRSGTILNFVYPDSSTNMRTHVRSVRGMQSAQHQGRMKYANQKGVCN